APRPIFREEAAERRTDDRRSTPDRRDVSLNASALRRLVQVGGDRRSRRENRTRGKSLHAAKDDQHDHAPRNRAEYGAGEKAGDADEQHGLATEDVGETAVDRNGHRLREQVDREDPGKERKTAQARDDLRD